MDSVARLGTILGIWAHPDDETFMTGGLIALAVANGQTVICVTATKGEAGVQDEARWPSATLGETRTKELAQALEILGISKHHWLGYKDGQCDQIAETDAVAQLVELIEEYQPDTIVTFPPDGLTGHPDHKTVSAWASQAAAAATRHPAVYFATQTKESYDAFWWPVDEKFNIYFATDKPVLMPQGDCDIHLLLPPEIAARKTAALKAMPSQYDALFEFLGDKGVEAAVGTEALVKA